MAFTSNYRIKVLVILHLVIEIYCRFEFTNVKCTSVDKKFGEVEYCYLKSVNRTYKYLSAKIKLYQLPMKDLEVNLVLMKRFNGYKPFLYNITVNVCQFLVNPKSKPVAKFVYESFATFTNFNHTCPYNHDLIVDKLLVEFINHRFTQVLAFPEGDYLIKASGYRSGSLFVVTEVYGTLSQSYARE